MSTVIGYLRVSTRDQAESGAGLAAQRSVIEAEAARRDWTVRWVEDAGVSGKSLRRDGITEALPRHREAYRGSVGDGCYSDEGQQCSR